MSTFSTYNARGINGYTQNFSVYAAYFDYPLLPSDVASYGCCVGYFHDYNLYTGIAGGKTDPDLPRNERSLGLTGDASFTRCYSAGGSTGPTCQGHSPRASAGSYYHFPARASTIVYPGCTVSLTVQGRANYRVTLGDAGCTNGGYFEDPVYYGDIQVMAKAYENPPCFTPNYSNVEGCSAAVGPCYCTCCPSLEYGYSYSEFSWIPADGLTWGTMAAPLYQAQEYFPSPTAFDYGCAQATWLADNPSCTFGPVSPTNGYAPILYPACINYVPEDSPVVEYTASGRTLNYYLINRELMYSRDYYCCEGDVFYDDRGYPSCTAEEESPTGPVYEDATTYFRDIDLVFFYTNKTTCVARLDCEVGVGNGYYYNPWYVDYCVGSDLKVTVDVIGTNAGC